MRELIGLVSLCLVVAAAAPAAGETPVERGRYLVEVLGACGNCHTPKGPTGDLPGQPGQEPNVKKLGDGALSFDGGLSITDLQQRLRLETLPDGSYQTAAGMVLAILGQLPSVGDAAEWEGWRFEVAEMNGFGIRRLVARRVGS